MISPGIAGTDTGKDRLLALIKANRLAEAKALAEALCQTHGGDAEIWHLRGVVCGSLGQATEAEACFRRAVELRPDYGKALRNLVIALRNQGKTEEAIASLQAVVRLEPDDAEARYSLGNLLYDAGDSEGAAAAYRETLRLQPDHALAHNNLATVHLKQGRPEEAVACCRQALMLAPGHVEAHYNLGLALCALKRTQEAEQSFLEALRLRPDYAEACFSLGLIRAEQKHWEEAVRYYRETVRLNPDHADAYNQLGAACVEQSQLEEATAAYRQAIRIRSDYAEAHNNLGIVLHKQGLLEEALAAYRQSLRINSRSIDTYHNMGITLRDLGRLEEAIECFKSALRVDPEAGEIYVDLGITLQDAKAPFEAMEWLKKGLDLDPDNVSMLENLANIQRDLGMLDDALANLKKALSIEPDRSSAVYGLIATMNYHPRFSPEEIFAGHLRWGRMLAPSHTELLPPDNAPDPDRKLRIGYVSPNFRAHSVAYFVAPVLASHDRARTEIFCYSDVPEPKRDDITRYFKGLDLYWRDSCGKSDLEVAGEIRQDRIDILVDLAGHTAKNRLGMFACRVAPVQITYLGYPNTTGLPAMDYRLTDEIADPPGQEAYYTEELVRLPHGFLCYSPMREPPGVANLPALERGFVTFGSFNASAKVTPQVIALWARILEAVPNSRILLKNHSLSHPPARERYHAQFEEHGIARDRVELVGWASRREEHLRLYDRVDIGLDTFPYNGTTTTFEALSMGVPVLTLSGDRHATRVGASILSCLGLERFIAVGEDDYAARAAQLASELDYLAHIRAGLRDTLTRSVLCDGKKFTGILEEAYRALWRRWCVAQRMP